MRPVSAVKRLGKASLFFLLERLALQVDGHRFMGGDRIRRILVVECGGIGDMLRVLPAIECLHANFPGAAISLLASPAGRTALFLFPRRDLIAEVIDYDLAGRHGSLAGKLALIGALRRRRFDLIYSPDRGEGMREKTIMTFLAAAPQRIGFTRGRVGRLNTIRREFRDDVPILEQNLALLEAASLSVTTRDIRIRVSPEDLATARRLIANPEGPLPWPLVSVHPGASWRAEYRMWPPDRYVALIRKLRHQLQASVIILGSQAERPLGGRLMAQLRDSAVCCAVGRTSIGEMAALIRLSHVFIGNDSGPLHIALALGTPSVGIFATTLPEQVLSVPEKCVAIRATVPGVRYYTHQHDFAYTDDHFAAARRISVDAVMQGVRQALGSRSPAWQSKAATGSTALLATPPGGR